MRNSKAKKIAAICEKCGWNVTINADEWELELGDTQFSFYAKPEEITAVAWDEYQNFDEDDFVKMYLDAAAHGLKGVPGVRRLLETAEMIENSLEALAMSSTHIKNVFGA